MIRIEKKRIPVNHERQVALPQRPQMLFEIIVQQLNLSRLAMIINPALVPALQIDPDNFVMICALVSPS